MKSTPDQKATVYWNMVCSKGTGAGSSSGHFTATTPIRTKLKKPYLRPDSCIVAADAQLNNGGWLHTYITYYRW
ncbi:MAG TPA: hypothetical protein VG253_11825 [Streptosporangiaceae bacterium]|nr:hypothetical protein [Streptosporangiaceae bacterium]